MTAYLIAEWPFANCTIMIFYTLPKNTVMRPACLQALLYDTYVHHRLAFRVALRKEGVNQQLLRAEEGD